LKEAGGTSSRPSIGRTKYAQGFFCYIPTAYILLSIEAKQLITLEFIFPKSCYRVGSSSRSQCKASGSTASL